MHTRRCIDVVVVLLALPWVIPVVAVLSVLIACTSPGGAWYSQIRMMRDRKPFRLYKLRTMRRHADQNGPLITLADDPRVTRIGAWLRATKLDELPQLWHVLTGTMSLVGPRPEVPFYGACFSGEGDAIYTVRPGLTNTASLVFSDEAALLAHARDPEDAYRRIILPEKIRLSLHDIAKSNVWYDLMLVVKTIGIAMGVYRLRCAEPILAQVRARIAENNEMSP